MPALNTPQFSWVLSRLPRHPQPVPPIYQPEVAARAIVHAADHPRRKTHWVGASTVATILGQHAVPAVLDRYLAKTGFSSQQTRDPADADRPDNLWRPLDGVDGKDYGAHGIFDDRALAHSPQRWLAEQPRSVSLAAVATTVLAVGGLALARRRH